MLSGGYNYKGFFSLVLIALVNPDYRLFWVDIGSSGSSLDAQIFNHSKLKKRIKDGTLKLPPPQPLGEGRPDLHYILLGDDTFALMPKLIKPYSSTQFTREKRIANYRSPEAGGQWRMPLKSLQTGSGSLEMPQKAGCAGSNKVNDCCN